jgi:hypothetical protein
VGGGPKKRWQAKSLRSIARSCEKCGLRPPLLPKRTAAGFFPSFGSGYWALPVCKIDYVASRLIQVAKTFLGAVTP